MEILFDFTYYCYERSLWHTPRQENEGKTQASYILIFEALQVHIWKPFLPYKRSHAWLYTRAKQGPHVQTRRTEERKQRRLSVQALILYIKRNAIISKPDTHSCMMISIYVWIYIFVCVFSTYTAKRFYMTMLIILLQEMMVSEKLETERSINWTFCFYLKI